MSSPPNNDAKDRSAGAEPHAPPPGQGGGARKEADPQAHSAEHILTAALRAMFGTGRPFTTHLERKKAKADYRFTRQLTAEEVSELERRVNEVVAADLAVREEYLPRAQAEQLYDLQRVPEEAGQTIRIVHIGHYDACACSGRHVRSTKEIGRFRVVSTTYQEGALRVRFKLDSLPRVDEEMTGADERAEVERREREIASGQVRPLSEAEFWRRVEADDKR